MIMRALGLVVIGALAMLQMPTEARANCAPGDQICKRFGQAKPAKAQKKRKAVRRKLRRRRARRPVRQHQAEPVATASIAQDPTGPEPPKTPPPPTLTVERLPLGSIPAVPNQLPRLVFQTRDRIEIAQGNCQNTSPDGRTISCTVAISRIALTTNSGAGCVNSLELRRLELERDAAKRWVKNDSIQLCGGVLTRQIEIYPVAINGRKSFALTESYSMKGGNHVCAAPYLESRKPWKRSYVRYPDDKDARLACGPVATN